jgi:hypothetical protein
MATTNKLSFTAQLQYAAYGVVGFLIPALAVSEYSGPHASVVVASAISIALLVGFSLGKGTNVTGS